MKIIYTLFLIAVFSTVQAQDMPVINEFMASNDSLSGISDPGGSYPDWIEIYNPADVVVDLAGFQVSDNYDVPDKFVFPVGSFIEADGYVIIWADKDLEEDGFHADFKLSSGGEQLILTAPDGTVADSLSFGEQETNVSFARIPNGTGDFTFRAPTFGFNNDMTAVRNISGIESAAIYPNPNQGILYYDFKFSDISEKKFKYSLQVRDINGKFVKDLGNDMTPIELSMSGMADMRTFPDGFYLLILRTETSVLTKKFFLRK